MKTPLFVTSSTNMLPNWREAFPDSTHIVGVPTKFDSFDSSIIFVDYMNLSAEKKTLWLAKCLATQRRVVVLSPTPEEKEAITVIKAGAVGYGHTLSAAPRLREMVLVVGHGGLWMGSKLMKHLLAALTQVNSLSFQGSASPVRKKDIGATLTDREKAVARHVARGATNSEISLALGVKERTVKAHITSIFDKLNARNRVELALLLNDVQIPEDPIENQSKRHAL